MRVKPKEVLLNLPTTIMFHNIHEISNFASNINQILHGKVKIKYEELGMLGGQYVGLFYLQRNDEFEELRLSFKQMIEKEEVENYSISRICHLDGYATTSGDTSSNDDYDANGIFRDWGDRRGK